MREKRVNPATGPVRGTGFAPDETTAGFPWGSPRSAVSGPTGRRWAGPHTLILTSRKL